jgi:hypothetical protein
MSKEERWQDLLKDAKQMFGFDADKVKELLKKHRYSGYREDMHDIYLVALRAEWYALDEQAELRKKDLEAKVARGIYIPIPCPVCGAPTVGDIKWYGRLSKKQGWRCTKGGIRHFLWAKANECREKQGVPAIPWEKFDAVYDPNFVVQNTQVS